MSTIYIVKSSQGEYEGYSTWNEKAFTSKEKAEEYAKELDHQHLNKPDFITDEFELLIDECEQLIPITRNPCKPGTIQYIDWFKEQAKKDDQLLCDLMYERGQYLTLEMLHQYYDWYNNSFAEYHLCEIEELELV